MFFIIVITYNLKFGAAGWPKTEKNCQQNITRNFGRLGGDKFQNIGKPSALPGLMLHYIGIE